MENLNISEKDIIKYKKLNYFKNSLIIFIIIFLITYGILKKILFYVNPSTIGIVFSLLLIIYIKILGIKFKKLNNDNKVYECMYSSSFLDKIIKHNDIKENSINILVPKDIYTTNKDNQYSMDLVNGIEIRIGLKIGTPIIIISTLIGLISMFYMDGETMESILEYGVFLIAPILLISGISTLLLCTIMTSNFKIQSKIKQKTINKIKNYYKLGCIDYLDCAAIERTYGYLILNDDLDTKDYLEILNKYNLSKEKLINKYIDLKAKESSEMLFLGLTILITIVMVGILDLSNNGLAILIGPALGKYVERKITSKRKKLLEEICTNNEKSNELFNRICDKNEYFQYCLSYLISNKTIHAFLG